MNRNTEQRAANVPRTHITRSKALTESRHLTTFNAGRLIPIYLDQDILPGQTDKINVSFILRMTTPIVPVMDNAYIDIYFFWVPNRIIWKDWRRFMGEATEENWVRQNPEEIPVIRRVGDVQTHETLDYMGIPTKFDPENISQITISLLPLRAYTFIYNEWFRDQNLDIPVWDNPSIVTPYATAMKPDNNIPLDYTKIAPAEKRPFLVKKFHDYFTSALPQPQKGEAVTINISGQDPTYVPAEVKSTTANHSIETNPAAYVGQKDGLQMSTELNHDVNAAVILPYGVAGEPQHITPGVMGASITVENPIYPTNLWAEVPNMLGSLTVSALREAVQTQKLLERDARGGTRYSELIKSHFATTLPDNQWRPEYIGGKRIPIQMSQVVQQSSTRESGQKEFQGQIGDSGAISITGGAGIHVTKSFAEHGILIGLACVRTDHTYGQGIKKGWMRRTREHYYWPEFANISEQPILETEIYVDQDAGREYTAFGWQEAWADYRYKPNQVSGLFRPNRNADLEKIPMGLWTYCDHYYERPSLTEEWLQEPLININRTLFYQATEAPDAKDDEGQQFMADFLFQVTSVKPMPIYSVPGLLDHF